MTDRERVPPEEKPEMNEVYFDLLADLDMTKHLGGAQATQELIEMCDIGESSHVLEVGCGVGRTPCHIAKVYGARVVGVDLYEKMIERSKDRALRERVADRVEFRVADAHNLPFDDDHFDVVICESVLALVPNQRRVASELVRVAKPGGVVGISESTWIKAPSQELLDRLSRTFSTGLGTMFAKGWQALLADVGLREIATRVEKVTVLSEIKHRFRRIGFKSIISTWFKLIPLLRANPDYRDFLREAFAEPRELITHWGYGLYVGRKE